ncbi:hypothetical protein COB21_05395 [Candidatus Aerophobetes bacterium]|uniref:Uncharacterized protein n=1 Tax=Aerophobetes bacterium TaxID=2030807 RepID=A0A2A4X035_UNCAE|nr:MAG: hypothetical protein COB21_05395 [Candidatus Aerophobetes bacterium]
MTVNQATIKDVLALAGLALSAVIAASPALAKDLAQRISNVMGSANLTMLQPAVKAAAKMTTSTNTQKMMQQAWSTVTTAKPVVQAAAQTIVSAAQPAAAKAQAKTTTSLMSVAKTAAGTYGAWRLFRDCFGKDDKNKGVQINNYAPWINRGTAVTVITSIATYAVCERMFGRTK